MSRESNSIRSILYDFIESLNLRLSRITWIPSWNLRALVSELPKSLTSNLTSGHYLVIHTHFQIFIANRSSSHHSLSSTWIDDLLQVEFSLPIERLCVIYSRIRFYYLTNFTSSATPRFNTRLTKVWNLHERKELHLTTVISAK